MLISIGIPTYNNAKTISQTIDSLISQSFQFWECFITDDSDSYDTINAAREAIGSDTRFTVIRNSQRLGAAENWNKALSLANGKYFKLLCADDLLSPNALELQFNALEGNTKAALCTGRRSIINENGRILIKDRGLKADSVFLDANQATNLFIKKGSNYFGEPSFAMFRTDILRDSGGFNKSWSYLIDVESYLRCLDSGVLVALNENLGSFRISSNSWSATLSHEQRVETIRFIDYASHLHYSSASKSDIMIGKLRATISSFTRRMIFFIS
jgi:glycosyltransferase involved in cell wall biosynthesis